MATATQIKLCPYCEDALPEPKPSACPHCGRKLPAEKKPSGGFFGCPDYLAFQKDSLLKGPNLKPGEAAAKEEAERLIALRDDLTSFAREAEAEVFTAALFDAHFILSHALHAKLDGYTLKRVVASAKAIGKLGEAIDIYIKSGGSVSDDGKTGETGQVFSSEDGAGRSATATAEGRGSR